MSKSSVVIAIAASVVAGVVFLRVRSPNVERSLPAATDEPESVEPSTLRAPSAAAALPPAPLPATATLRPTGIESDASQPLDATSLLAKLHELGISDPPLSLKLAREAVTRFPDSPAAPEFEWNVVKALFNMQRLEEAKAEARTMLWQYPDSHFTVDVDRHLLHPQPNSSIEPGN